MKRIKDFGRTRRLIEETRKALNLDLRGMNVLTEAASGNFAVTPVIAAMAGAETVYVVSRDSSYGTVKEVREHLDAFAEACGIAPAKIIYTEDKNSVAGSVNVVTNSGFVRPIDDRFISSLPADAGISLMFESWEFRPEDIDLESCVRHNVPVLGVNENDERLKIFRYVGLDVLKLLFEEQIEVFKGRFLVLSSGSYLKEIRHVLDANGAAVTAVDTEAGKRVDGKAAPEDSFDAIVVAEQKNAECLLGEESRYIDLRQVKCDGPVIHIAGVVDDDYIRSLGYRKNPDREIRYGHMGVTTEYMGVRPVVELNAAGLKAGQLLVEGMRKTGKAREAQAYALKDSCTMAFKMIE